MATILYFGTSGSDDPTKAVLPFITALGAVEAGHQAQIALMGEATYLMKDSVAEAVRGVGWPSAKELLTKAVEQGITIHVWGGCSQARGVTDADLQGKNAHFINPKIGAELTVAADRVVSF